MQNAECRNPGSHPKPPQSHFNATSKPPRGEGRMQNAECRKARQSRPEPGTCAVQARYEPSASQVQARCMGGTCVVHAWYMRGTSHPEPIPKLRELEVSRRAAVLLPWGFRSHYNGSCLFRQGCVRPCATFSRRSRGRGGRRPYQARSRQGAAHLNR